MKPPIHQCVIGHTFCHKCKSILEKCPTCQAEIQNTRNYAVEEVAYSLKLPSSTTEKTNGEVTAFSKIVTCPTVNCYDTYDIQTIGNHFKEKHMDFFHWNNFTIKNVYSYFNIDVLVRYGKTYIVLFDYNDTLFGICICSISGDDDCQYEVKLTTDEGKFSILSTGQKIVPFDENEHCFKCLAGACKNDDHKYRLVRKPIFKHMPTKLNRDSVNRTFNYKSLNYVVNIIDSRKVFLKELTMKRDKVFRHMYECPICKDYMLPPIHQCLSGHILCHVCKEKVEKCPSCEGKIDATRNYILEDASENVEIPCQFKSERCRVRAGVKRIASHEADCPFKSKKLCVVPEEQIE
ncbi:hypothetical protein NQ314_017947 [Rhamnusium bicolor]|uniref:RING-type domain-containing protein n=1 Tax=Rhamnusium bicolor TaxID=1586634 RepID=A0AAV8WUF3_9CUCU|nr:hypothetical protein NQ314_017947 [Rhamnusium bicolor]